VADFQRVVLQIGEEPGNEIELLTEGGKSTLRGRGMSFSLLGEVMFKYQGVGRSPLRKEKKEACGLVRTHLKFHELLFGFHCLFWI